MAVVEQFTEDEKEILANAAKLIFRKKKEIEKGGYGLVYIGGKDFFSSYYEIEELGTIARKIKDISLFKDVGYDDRDNWFLN